MSRPYSRRRAVVSYDSTARRPLSIAFRGDLGQMLEQPLLQLTFTMNRNRNLLGTPLFLVDVVASADAQQSPAVSLETLGELPPYPSPGPSVGRQIFHNI